MIRLISAPLNWDNSVNVPRNTAERHGTNFADMVLASATT
jgi:hypothetical protein